MKFSCSLQMTTRQVLLTCSVSLATRDCQWTQTRAPGRWWWWRTVQNRSGLRFWRRVLGHQGWDVVLARTSVRTTKSEKHHYKPQCPQRMSPTEMMNSVTGARARRHMYQLTNNFGEKPPRPREQTATELEHKELQWKRWPRSNQELTKRNKSCEFLLTLWDSLRWSLLSIVVALHGSVLQ
jgi:hypothetical protein